MRIRVGNNSLHIPFTSRPQTTAVAQPDVPKRANPVSGQDRRLFFDFGLDPWRPQTYGEYIARNISIFSAIQIRSNAIASVPVRIMTETFTGDEIERMWVGPRHPAQQLVDIVNPFWTRGDLWKATETYIGLWGAAFWSIVQDGRNIEIWPLRPDRMKVVPGADYIKGYVYTGQNGNMIPFLVDEIIRFNIFNPLDEFSGLSPIAPLRLSLDMAHDALRSNRHTLVNDATPGLIIETQDTPTDDEVEEFWERWNARHQGATSMKRPAVLSNGMKASNLGFSPKEMEYVANLRWTLEDVARAYDIPKMILHDTTQATYSNYEQAWRQFWQGCLTYQMQFYAERLQEFLLPRFGSNLIAQFDTSNVPALQEDAAQKAATAQIYTTTGVKTINEVRAELNLPPVEWGDDDPRASTSGFDLFGGRSGRRSRQLLTPDEWEPAGERALEALYRALDDQERSFKRLMVMLFNEQTDAMIEALETQRTAVLAGTNGHSRQEENTPGSGSNIFRPQDWLERFVKAGSPLIRQALRRGAANQIEQFSLGVAFDVSRPLTEQWIEQRTLFWADRVNTETARLVTEQVKRANELGESISQLKERVQQIGEFNNEVRAFTVARTEMVSATNEGHVQAYETAEIPGKRWITSRDDRVRDTHREAHGQVRRVRENFSIGADSMPAPAQGSRAEENVNCRCTTVPVFEVK